jgi:hypothetical protein
MLMEMDFLSWLRQFQFHEKVDIALRKPGPASQRQSGDDPYGATFGRVVSTS